MKNRAMAHGRMRSLAGIKQVVDWKRILPMATGQLCGNLGVQKGLHLGPDQHGRNEEPVAEGIKRLGSGLGFHKDLLQRSHL